MNMGRVAWFSVVACVLWGCGEGGDVAEGMQSLLVGTWRQTAHETRAGSAEWAQPADARCRLDNVEEYEEDGSWVVYDGTDQCGAGTGITRGTWRSAVSDTKVIFTYAGASGEYESTVVRVSDTELVLTHSTGDVQGTQVRSTYRRQ